MQFHTLALALVVSSSTSHGGIAAFSPGISCLRSLSTPQHSAISAKLDTKLFASEGKDQPEEREIKIPDGLPLDAGKALDGIDAVEAEALKAIEAANEALRGAQINIKNNVDENDQEDPVLVEQRRQMQLIELRREKEKQMTDVKKKAQQELQKEAFVSAVGGLSYGILGGIVLDIALVANDIEVDATLPPLVMGTGLAVTGFVLGLQESQVGSTTRTVFGGPIKNVANSVSSAIAKVVDTAVEEVKATPSKIKTAVDQKVKETTDEIKSIPQKVKEKAIETVNKTAGEIRAIPEKVKDETIKAVEKTKEDIQLSTQKAAEEIKATPGRVAEESKKKVIEFKKDLERQVEETVEQIEKSVEQKIDEIVSFPGKTLDELSETVSKVLPIEQKPIPTVQVPKPPESPPPAALLKDTNKVLETGKQSTPTQPLPKVAIPTISVSDLPKLQLPSIPIPTLKETVTYQQSISTDIQSNKNALPKVDIPKISVPDIIPKVKFQKMPLSSSRKESSQTSVPKSSVKEPVKKQTQDNFVFSENEVFLRKKKEEEATKRKRVFEEKEQQKLEASKKKRQMDDIKKAQTVIDSAKPRTTISLGFLNFLSSKNDEQIDMSSSTIQSSPVGIPILSSWKQNPDGSITGLISGSKTFRDKESITTSPIKTQNLSEQSVVITTSGSKYYLGKQATTSLLFRGKTKQPEISTQDELEKRKADVVQRRANVLASAEESKRLVEEKRAAAVRDAEERKQLAEEKRMKSLEEIAKKNQEIKDRKASAKEQALQMRKSKTVTVNSNEAKKAENLISTARKGATVSLGFLGFGGQNNQGSTVTDAPLGVPTINKWKKNSDGSVTGLISGSKAFGDGESITTSPLTSDPSEGTIVVTISGSKYFLKSESKGFSFFVAESKPSTSSLDTKRSEKSLSTKQPEVVKKSELPSSKKSKNEEAGEKIPTIKSKADMRVRDQQAESEKVLANAKPRASISLDFLKFAQSVEDQSNVAMPEPKIVSQAPRGVPTLTNWKSNRDGSVTGSILNSRAYNDGDLVTTSPLTTASVDGALVQTISGSRYFLAPTASSREVKKAELDRKRAAQQSASEAKKVELEQKRATQKAVAAAKIAELEQKRAAQKTAIEAKKAELEQKKASTQNSEESQKRLDAITKSKKALSIAKSGATISLGFLKFGQSDDVEISSTETERPPVIASKAPSGVPTLSKWKRNRDGSITGFITGSKAFSEGESITTSPIVGFSDGGLVQTSSGSKYFLAPNGGTAATKTSSPISSSARKGVPKLINWRRNRDDSITGFISGSPNFDEGEKITTSPITSGKIGEGQLVRTGSGSSYYLV